MMYRKDPVYKTVQWLRAKNHPETFADIFADAWSRWARVRPCDMKVHIGLINYKPFERARVMADVTFVPGRPGSDTITVNLFLHIFADAEAARQEFQTSGGMDLVCCYAPPVFHVEARHLVAWTLPNAPNLEELKELLDPESFRRLLGRSPDLVLEGNPTKGPTLGRYVPLKRAILTWSGPATGQRYYLKVIASPAAAAAALNLRELAARAFHGELNFAVPKPVLYSPDLHTMIMSEVPGRRFTDIMREGRPRPFADVGKALAGLHSLATSPETILSAEKELAGLTRHSEELKRALPKLGARLDAVIEQLGRPPAIPPAAFVPIHGNLSGDQILHDETAEAMRVGIIGWKTWSSGDRHFDVGRLIAHFLYIARIEGLHDAAVVACIDALLGAYQDSEEALDRLSLEWHVAAALLVRAKISSLRKLRAGWPKHCEFALTDAERIMNGGGFTPRGTSQRADTGVRATAPRELVAV